MSTFRQLSLVVLGVSLASPSFAQRFLPTAINPESVKAIGGHGEWDLGFNLSSTYPLAAPYTGASGSSSQDFRFQVPVSLGLELGYGLSNNWELALGLSYAKYESRLNTGTSGGPQFQTASLRMIPVDAIGRYRWRNVGVVVPEIEFGAGVAMTSLDITSTNVADKEYQTSSSPVHAFGAIGFGTPWTEGFSVHGSLGYSWTALPSSTYTNTTANVNQSSLSGVYFKGQLRYKF